MVPKLMPPIAVDAAALPAAVPVPAAPAASPAAPAASPAAPAASSAPTTA